MVQQQVQTNQRRYTLNDILDKEQFKIKLNIRYYLFSGTNLVILVAVYFFTSSSLSFFVFYILGALGGYKFVFNLTKDGKQYQPYLIKKAAQLIKAVRLRQMEVKNV